MHAGSKMSALILLALFMHGVVFANPLMGCFRKTAYGLKIEVVAPFGPAFMRLFRK